MHINIRIISALLLTTAAAVVAVGVSSGNGAAQAQPQNRALDDRFGAFKRERNISDALPAAVVARFADPQAAGALRLNAETSRLLSSQHGERIFLARGGGNACAVNVANDVWSMSCAPEAALANSKGGIVVAQVSAPGEFRVYGALGDGSRDAAVQTNDGISVAAVVAGGAVNVAVAGVPTALTWTAFDGSPQTQVLQVPAGS